MSKQPPQTFAAWLGSQVTRPNLTPDIVAEAAGVTPAAVHGWIRGVRPGGPSVAAVIEALGSTPEETEAAWAAYHVTVRVSRGGR